MSSTWLTATDPDWTFHLEKFQYDIYHLPSYTALDARQNNGAGQAFLLHNDNSTFFLPIVRRAIQFSSSGLQDAISPYGYPGPLSDPNDLNFFLAGLNKYKLAGQSSGLVSSFIRLHPLLNLGIADQLKDPDMIVLNRGNTVSIDLSIPMEQLNAHLGKKRRYELRKLAKEGYSVHFNNWDNFPDFISIYTETMSRVKAGQFYFFPDDYFSELKEALGDSLVLCTVIDGNGKLAAGGLFGNVNDIAQYHLGATATAHLPMSPTKLMFAEVRKYFKELGTKYIHLGGGVGGKEDSLFQFKRAFGSVIRPFFTIGIIHDTKEYARLSKHRTEKNSNYFPAYRSPSN